MDFRLLVNISPIVVTRRFSQCRKSGIHCKLDLLFPGICYLLIKLDLPIPAEYPW